MDESGILKVLYNIADNEKVKLKGSIYVRNQLTYGFTLPELLIALVILAEIATFTIPKVLSSQQNSQSRSAALEVAAMIVSSYQSIQLAGTASSGIRFADMTQYINYVQVDTSSTIDEVPGFVAKSCASYACLKLHNGGILMYKASESFSGTATTNGIWFLFDPDAQASSVKSVSFLLTAPGRITSSAYCPSPISSSAASYTCAASYDPSWFSW